MVNNPKIKINTINITSYEEIEKSLAYLDMDETKASEYKCFLIVLLLFIGVVAFGCEDQEKDLFSKCQQAASFLLVNLTFLMPNGRSGIDSVIRT